jgi:hypothetical protein
MYYVNWAELPLAVGRLPVLEVPMPTSLELNLVQATRDALREEIAKRRAYERNRAIQRNGADRSQEEREEELSNNPPDAISGGDLPAEQESDNPGIAPRLTDNECPGSYWSSIYLVEEGRSGSNACF